MWSMYTISLILLKLLNGYFKLINSDNSSSIGEITIKISPTDYRETPFNNIENLKECFNKWSYFKYNGVFIKCTHQQKMDPQQYQITKQIQNPH